MSFKRQADTELTQDNVHEMDKEVSDKAKHDTWKRAPDEVLATRKILKVSETAAKPAASGGGGGGFAAYAKINPFAAMGPPMGFGTSSNKTAAPIGGISKITTNLAPKATPPAPPSTSPKTNNPFGASNPAHNPFMNFVADSKPNVDYWQKFKEPVKVSASDSVSSSDVKVTFVNPSSSTNKQQQEGSASALTTSAPKLFGDNSITSSTTASSTASISKSSSQETPAPASEATSTQNSEDSNEVEKDEEIDTEETDNAATSSSTSIISEKKPVIDTAAMFHKPTELDNGEAGEECVLKLRAKLYRLAEVEKASAVAKEWVEVGTGPVRLLTPSEAEAPASDGAPVFPRIVMRREHQAGGPGTKVILNASFRSHFSVAKMGERAARLTCLAVPPSAAPKTTLLAPAAAGVAGGEGKDVVVEAEKEEVTDSDVKPLVAIPMTFLFKMQHSHEADQFIKHITVFLEKSKKEDKEKEDEKDK